MQPAQPPFPDGAANALQQHTVALEAALHSARQQQAAYMAALSTAQPTGHTAAAMTAAMHASSLNQGMAAASQQWGDPNARLDSMLNEMVAFKLKQRAPTVRRRPAKSITSPVASSSSPQIQTASTGQPTGFGNDNLDSQWELVSTPGQTDGSEHHAVGTTAGATHMQQQQVDETIQPSSSFAVEGEEYELYYEDEDGEVEGAPPYNEQELGMDAGALEQVLELRLQLHDLDVENNALKQQLEQQKKLMAQLQASLLMGAPSATLLDNKEASAAAAAATGPGAATATVPDQPTDTNNSNSSQHDKTMHPPSDTPQRPVAVSVPETTTGSMTGSGQDALAGFDALAAAPRGHLSSPTARPPTTPEPFQPHTVVAEHAAPQSPPPPATHALQPMDHSYSSASSANTTAVSQQAYHLAPGVDILEGLGLAHQTQKSPTLFQPNPQVNTHQDQEHPPVARTPSEGELAAIRAVQEFESQQVKTQGQPIATTATTNHGLLQHPASPPPVVQPASQPHHTASHPAAHAPHTTQQHPVYPNIISTPPHAYTYPPPPYPHAAPQYPASNSWAYAHDYKAAQWAAGHNTAAGPTGGWGASPYTSPYAYQATATPAYPTQSPYTSQYTASHYTAAAHTTGHVAQSVVAAHDSPQQTTMSYTPAHPQITYPVQATGAQAWHVPVPTAAAQTPPPQAVLVSTGDDGSTPTAGTSWSCQVCTYQHAGKEYSYLRCAICNAQK